MVQEDLFSFEGWKKNTKIEFIGARLEE